MINQEKIVRAITILVQKTHKDELKWTICDSKKAPHDIANVVRSCYTAKYLDDVFLMVYKKSIYRDIGSIYQPLQNVNYENVLAFTNSDYSNVDESFSGKNFLVVNELIRAIEIQLNRRNHTSSYLQSIDSILGNKENLPQK